MALNLGAMIQAARTQKNPAGDFIANYDNQIDRSKAEEQRLFNNNMKMSELVAQLNGMKGLGGMGGIGGAGMMGGAG